MSFSIDKIHEVVNTFWELEGWSEDCYIIDVVHRGKTLEVFVDRDGGINLESCQKTSRAIEAYLDESLVLTEEYTLEVSSPGVGAPLRIPRQYKNNIGRTIEVKAYDQKIEGTLTSADESQIAVGFVEKRKEGKKNIKVDVLKEIPYTDITSARIKVSFK